MSRITSIQGSADCYGSRFRGRDPFLDPLCLPETLDLYCVRTSILRALRAVLPLLSGTVLDIGSGEQPYKSLLLTPPSRAERYLAMDLSTSRHRVPDIEWDGHVMPLPTACVESAVATEVLEHVPRPEAFLAETFRVLKSSGIFFFTTPFLWPLHDVPFDAYRLTPWSLDRYLREAGFIDIDLQPYGGWHRSLAQMIGLWVRRSPMSKRKRTILSRAAVPVVRYLIAHDQVPATFEESSMLPGIAGTARKRT